MIGWVRQMIQRIISAHRLANRASTKLQVALESDRVANREAVVVATEARDRVIELRHTMDDLLSRLKDR